MKPRRWVRPLLALLGLVGLLALQAWAYFTRLNLSLGPRVILQPWLLQRGLVMYRDIADLHSPLMPLTIAAFVPLVPDGLALARLVLVVLLSLTTILTFVAGWRTAGPWAGLAAAAIVVLWSPLYGFGKLWHESFLAPLYLLLFLCYDPSARRLPRSSLLAGFVGGAAVLYKQQAALVFAAFVLWSVWTHWLSHRSCRGILREVALLGLGACLPVAAYAIFQYARAGSLGGFLYWTIGFNLTSGYGSLAALPPAPGQVRAMILSGALVLPALLVCVHSRRSGTATWPNLGLALLLLGAACATAYPRFEPFHLQAALPLLALVSTFTLEYLFRYGVPGRSLARVLALAAAVLWLAVAAHAYGSAFKTHTRQTVSEYSDLVPLAQEVRKAIGPTGCVYIFPDDEALANLYYLLRCSPPGLWVFHYPWYMLDPIRGQMMSSLKANAPQWVVHAPGRWGVESRAPEIVAYLQANYRREASLPWAQGEVWLLKRLP